MSEENKTTFIVETMPNKIKRFAWLIMLIGLIGAGLLIWGNIGAGARDALSHAKDIRVALKLMSLEYYSNDCSIFDPESENGLVPGALEKLSSTIPIDGELCVTGWDRENNIPLSFTYREGKYLVEYKDIGQGDGTYGMNGDWIVYCDFKVLEYTTGD
ncbi:MAG: hypothetical protein K5871_10970 [Lachnospiraceae bacterium]|nr:hypothetical protein [Lachnospiraceae bacterium]